MKKLQLLMGFALLVLLSACQKDMRPKSLRNTVENEQALEAQARELLQAAYEAHGMDELLEHENYEVNANFSFHFPWQVMNMNPFKVSKKEKVLLHYAVNSFDGSVEYLNGKKEGRIYGTQSFQGYKQYPNEDVEYKKEGRHGWGVTAYHYLLEIPLRIQSATIVKYAGQEVYNGILYDKVFATWQNEEPNKEFDQWILYINPDTKRIDMLMTTIKEYYMPIPGFMYATVLFRDYQKVGEKLIMPHKFVFQMFKPKKKENKYVYTVNFSDYKFDSFPLSQLYPDKELPVYGDTKPAN